MRSTETLPLKLKELAARQSPPLNHLAVPDGRAAEPSARLSPFFSWLKKSLHPRYRQSITFSVKINASIDMNNTREREPYAINRKASFDYEILETHEAGIELFGFEVKAVKSGRIVLSGAFAVPRGMEFWLTNASIPPYQPANTPRSYVPDRPRRLLLHKKEIAELIGKSKASGLTIIPLRVYSKNSKLKVLLGVARRKKSSDKREKIKKRDMSREAERALLGNRE